MTPRKEPQDEKKETLEQILRSVRSIDRNVVEMLERVGECDESRDRGYDDEWKMDDYYGNNGY